MNIISSTERLGMAEKKLNNAAPTFPNLLSRHRLGYVHIWRYADGVAIPLSTSDVTIYCVTLRWFSNLPSAKQSQAIKQAKPSWFRPQLSYLHQCPSQDTDHNIRRTVFSIRNDDKAPIPNIPSRIYVISLITMPNFGSFHITRQTQGCDGEVCAEQISPR